MSASCCLETPTRIPLGESFLFPNTQFLFRVEKQGLANCNVPALHTTFRDLTRQSTTSLCLRPSTSL
jgi:hypothetical protein